LRAAARTLIAKADAVRGVKLYVEALDKEQSSASERQLALAGLASLGTEAADAILSQWAERLERGQTPAELQLDVVEAVSARELPEARERVRRFQASLQKGAAIDRFRTSLVGGDAERGREIFTGHRVAQCVRCHKIRGQGGDAGPDLSEVSKRHERIGLLESLIDPNAKIAPNFGTVSLVLQDGRIVAGMLVKETSQAVTLTLADGRSQEIPVTEIDERSAPRSAMPAVDRALSPRELRDVVEYLSTLR
jgi:quinoprotein glucose dehydrogenase